MIVEYFIKLLREAQEKCDEASAEYNHRLEKLEREERRRADAMVGVDKESFLARMKELCEKDIRLTRAANRQSFWSSEVVRLSAYIQAEIAYAQHRRQQIQGLIPGVKTKDATIAGFVS